MKLIRVMAVVCLFAVAASAQIIKPGGGGGGGGTVGTPYEATGTATSVSITADTHGKGTKPIWGPGSCFTTATGVAITTGLATTVAANGDVSASWTGSIAYTCRVFASGQQGSAGATGATGAAGSNGADGAPGANGEVTDEALQSGRHLLGVDAGGDDAYAVTLSPAPTAYDTNGTCIDGEICDGEMMHLRVSTANTGAAAIVVNGLSSKSIVMPDGTTLTDGMIRSTAVNIIMYNRSGDYWQIAGGASSGSGATTFSGLTDCTVTRTSSTVLTISACRVTMPNGIPATLSSATVTNVSGAGVARIHINSTPSIRVVTSGDLVITCSGCTDDGAGTAYPVDTASIARWTSTAGAWDATITGDDRSMGIHVPIQISAGAGITRSDVGGVSTYAADTTYLETKAANQAGGSLLCSGSASTTATCTMTPTLLTYTTGMRVNFLAGATNTTTYTLNIDTLGAKSILTSSAGALSAGDITSGRYYMLTYDGTQFLLPPSGGTVATNASCVIVAPTSDFSATAAAAALVANTIYGMRFRIDVPCSFDEIQMNPGNTTAGNWNAGVYSIDGATKYIDAGSSATSSTGIKTNPFTPVVLQPGSYWLVFAADNATTTYYTVSINNLWGASTQDTSMADGMLLGTQTSGWTSGDLPSTITLSTVSAGAVFPLVVLKN